MAAPKEIVWTLEPHTRAKHAILRRYLQAWMPILSRGNFPEILYVDGFAGPGEYRNGEDGSPLIALKAALAHEPPLRATIHFLFVEKDKARAEHLKSIIERLDLPSNFRVVVECMTFEEAWRKHYTNFLRRGRLIPTFAFIDPFGWAGAPLSLVREITQHANCEVFVNFMYEEINRFIGHPDQIVNFDSFFGTNEWRECEKLHDPRERNRCLHDLYKNQLRTSAGIRQVRSFEMSNRKDVTDYFLFYGTNNPTGLKKMKEAMWKVDESGEFRFSDATDPDQLVLFAKEPNLDRLRTQIVARFAGQRVMVQEVEDFVIEETAFRDSHYKGILKTLEQESHLEVISAKLGRRRGTFGDPNMVILIRVKQ